jgi:hypothetical protein
MNRRLFRRRFFAEGALAANEFGRPRKAHLAHTA